MIRFVAFFAAYLGMFYVLILFPWVDRLFYEYLRANAWLANLALRGLGQQTRLEDVTVRAVEFAISVRRGCDGLEPAWFFSAAVLAFPSPWRHKPRALLVGAGIILALNLVRIVSLFLISATSSTTFSRPEDGAWSLANPREYYFVTTDRLDQVSDGLGAQIGQTRLWRLTFDDITNPDLGGKIDLLIDGRTVGGEKVNMFDNIALNEKTGHLLIQEDVGGAPHNGKVWDYDPATDVLVKVAKHDPARFGDRVGGVTTAATAPFTNDEETSGVIDVSSIMSSSSLNKGNPREAWYLTSDQAHYSGGTTGITTSQVEGGQLVMLHALAPVNNVDVARSPLVRDRRTGTYAQQVTITNNTGGALTGPFYLVLDSLSANATLNAPAGSTAAYAPLGSPYVQVTSGNLAPGASASITLQFTNPSNANVTYTARTLNSVGTP